MLLLSFVLLSTDRYADFLDKPRFLISSILYPIHATANFPNKVIQMTENVFASREYLQERVLFLEGKVLLIDAEIQKMVSLEAENNRLRQLLGSAAKVQEDILVAEVIGIDPDPMRQNVLINKGRIHGVFEKQSVIDSQGLLGQIIEVSDRYSRIMLVSDENSFVPVSVARNNLRLMLRGGGISQTLTLMHVNATADIKVGDQLVSSGLGERFLPGYPVGLIQKIDYVEGKPFAVVTALPRAKLDRSRYVLLIFSKSGKPVLSQGSMRSEFLALEAE